MELFHRLVPTHHVSSVLLFSRHIRCAIVAQDGLSTGLLSLSELQRLYSLADFLHGQPDHQHLPVIQHLLGLQTKVHSKLDAVQHSDAIASLPYEHLSRVLHSLRDLLQADSQPEPAEPFMQLTSICIAAQEASDLLHSHLEPAPGRSASAMAGYATFWGLVQHSGANIPGSLHRQSATMAGNAASVTLAALQSFLEVSNTTLGLTKHSNTEKFLHHFLTHRSSLFQGYLMAHLRADAQDQHEHAVWPGKQAASLLLAVFPLLRVLTKCAKHCLLCC